MSGADVTLRGRGVVRGEAEGPALVARAPISFLGDIDIGSGRIVGRVPGVAGETVAGKVLVMPDSMGSAGAWRFLFQLHAHGTHPLAVISNVVPDASFLQGAILAGIPVVCGADPDPLTTVATGDRVAVDGGTGLCRVRPKR